MLGLERVERVARRMRLPRRLAPLTLTVGGTNGKGSTVEILRVLLAARGMRVGTYTSPHLLDVRERICLGHRFVEDDELLAALEAVERASRRVPELSLTWFEYFTLAAAHVLHRQALDAVILEIGLGGRLDAVNWFEHDGALLTTVDLDHREVLGHTRAAIGREKAGIFRRGLPAVYGDLDPEPSVLAAAARRRARLLRRAVDFDWRLVEGGFEFRLGAAKMSLPRPGLPGAAACGNVAAALALLSALTPPIHFDAAVLRACLPSIRLAGRMQRIGSAPEWLLDVGHNPQAAASLAQGLLELPQRRPLVAVYSGLAGKDHPATVAPLVALVDHWIVNGLADRSPRGLEAETLSSSLSPLPVLSAQSLSSALARAAGLVGADGRVLVYGSFVQVEGALRWLGVERLEAPPPGPL